MDRILILTSIRPYKTSNNPLASYGRKIKNYLLHNRNRTYSVLLILFSWKNVYTYSQFWSYSSRALLLHCFFFPIWILRLIYWWDSLSWVSPVFWREVPFLHFFSISSRKSTIEEKYTFIPFIHPWDNEYSSPLELWDLWPSILFEYWI